MKRYIPAILLSCCMIVVSGCGGDRKEPADGHAIQSEEVTETPAAVQTPEVEDSGREVTPVPESKMVDDNVASVPQRGEADLSGESNEQISSEGNAMQDVPANESEPEAINTETPDATVSQQTDSSGEEKEIRSIDAYVLETVHDANGNVIMIYVDTENPGERTYPQEGEDRKVPFNIEQAEIEIDRNEAEWEVGLPTTIRRSIAVYMEYYVENGENIVTYLRTDAIEF